MTKDNTHTHLIGRCALVLYTLLMVCMGLATVIERCYGNDIASSCIYGAWWFVVLWAIMAGAGMTFIIRKKLYKRFCVFTLHLSFVGILLGALVTFLTAQRGTVHLRMHQQTNMFITDEGRIEHFPFLVSLQDFHVVNYPGTDAPMDYVSTLHVLATGESMEVSMNNIATVSGYRFYQLRYDEDMQGSSLLVSYDPWGIGITYTFYLTLLLSIIGIVISRLKGTRLLNMTGRGGTAGIMLLAVLLMSTNAAAEVSDSKPHLIPEKQVEAMKDVAVLYNGRICPLNTAAIDFVTKLSGKPSWQGLSPDEVFLSWMIYSEEWEREPIIRIKSGEVQRILGIDDGWASLRDFYTSDGKYKLWLHLVEHPMDKDLREADEKVHVIGMLYAGEFLKIFPHSGKWYSPDSTSLPRDIPGRESLFIRTAMKQWMRSVLAGDDARAHQWATGIKDYQQTHADIPGTLRVEVAYNGLLAMRWVVYLFLTLSLVLCVCCMLPSGKSDRMRLAQKIMGGALFLYLTTLLALRWIISGHVPLSNGFETMQFLAWAIALFTLLAHHRLRNIASIGPLVASFALLVSAIASGSPQITPLMPVLHSPLLTLHVLCVMLAYAIFALQAIEALVGLLRRDTSARQSLVTWNLMGVLLLTIGIFLGAVWANVSWGRYWGWDPKETWALITLMIYALPLHPSLITLRDRAFQWYILLAFFSVIMTYFGVNYLLPGMHSYA